jgi:DNA-binding CsgD family transcriptional regulator
MALESLARIQLTTGRWAEAGPNIGDALRIASEVGNRLRLADCLATAAVWATGHDPEAAAVLWGASRALSRAIGWHRLPIADITDNADTGSASDSRFYTAPMLDVRARLGSERARMADQRGANMSFDTVIEFVRRIIGESPRPAAGTTIAASGLTRRERELVSLVARGRTDAQIAQQLYISVRTVRSHLDRIRDKTGCRRRADLTRLALETGLVYPLPASSPCG